MMSTVYENLITKLIKILKDVSARHDQGKDVETKVYISIV